MKYKTEENAGKVDCVILNFRQNSIIKAEGLRDKLSQHEGSVNELFTIDINTGKFPPATLEALKNLKEGGKIYIRGHGGKSGKHISSDPFKDPNNPTEDQKIKMSVSEIIKFIHKAPLPKKYSIHYAACHAAESKDPQHPEKCLAFYTGVAVSDRGDRDISIYGKIGATKIKDGRQWSRAPEATDKMVVNKRKGSKREFYVNSNSEIIINDSYSDKWLYTFNILGKLISSQRQAFDNLIDSLELEFLEENRVYTETNLKDKFQKLRIAILSSSLIDLEINLLIDKIDFITASLSKEADQHHNIMNLIEKDVLESMSTEKNIEMNIANILEQKEKTKDVKLNSERKDSMLRGLTLFEEDMIETYKANITDSLNVDQQILKLSKFINKFNAKLETINGELLLNSLKSLTDLKVNSEQQYVQLESELQNLLPDQELMDVKSNLFYDNLNLEQIHDFTKKLNEIESKLKWFCNILQDVLPIELAEQREKLNFIAWAKSLEHQIEEKIISNNLLKNDLDNIQSEINVKKNSSSLSKLEKFVIHKVEHRLDSLSKRNTPHSTRDSLDRFWKQNTQSIQDVAAEKVQDADIIERNNNNPRQGNNN